MGRTTTPAQDLRKFRDGAAIGIAAETPAPGRIVTAFRTIRASTLSALIVALCAIGGARDLSAQMPSKDLSGRWTSQRHGYVLDVTRCGAEWCGIKLKPDQSCGALALRLTSTPSTDGLRGLVGSLILEPTVRTYKISASTSPAGAMRPNEIHLLGNPNDPPQLLTRTILFQDTLVRGPEANCTAESKPS